MSFFKSRKKFRISEPDPTFKVRYLGNVQTALMKGEGCVDRPTGVLWNNFARSSGTVGLDMTITICISGMKAVTDEQGLTEYRSHRISYCVAHPLYPRVFVWVYRHEGKRMKVELRCHAVMCKSEAKAKLMAVTLHDKLTFALSEFMRDKRKRQNSRIALQKTNSFGSLPSDINSYGTSKRHKLLSNGHKFKPSVEMSSSAPKMGTITESNDEEKEAEVSRVAVAQHKLSLSFSLSSELASRATLDDVMNHNHAKAVTSGDEDGTEQLCDDVIDINPAVNMEEDSCSMRQVNYYLIPIIS